MRGTHSLVWRSATPDRFIPAHAGNSPLASVSMRPPPVHPRACGELILCPLLLRSNTGSSPRMRGTRRRGTHHRWRNRFIPAHAGNSHAPSKWWLWLHGSSPRMRGTQHKVLHRNAGPRFIPAHAGNSGQPTHDQRSLTVHPRACGELRANAVISPTDNGSSPRMRGTPVRQGTPHD